MVSQYIEFNERHYIAGVLYSDSYAVGTWGTGFQLMEGYARGVALINVGDMVAGSELGIYLQQATTADGSGAKAITQEDGTTLEITNLFQADGDGDDILILEFQAEHLDVNNGFNYVQLHVTCSDAAVELSAFLIYWGGYEPVPTTNVTEIVRWKV